MSSDNIEPAQAIPQIAFLQQKIERQNEHYQTEMKQAHEDLIRKDMELKYITDERDKLQVERDKLQVERDKLQGEREDLRVKWEILKRELKLHQDNLSQQKQHGCWKLFRAFIFAFLASTLFYAATALENLGNSMLSASSTNSPTANTLLILGWVTYSIAAIFTFLLPFIGRGK